MRARLAGTLVLALLLPTTIAQETTVVPEPFEYPPCDVPAPERFAELGTALENLAFGNGSLFVTAFDEGLYRLDPDGNATHVAASDRAAAATETQTTTQRDAFMGVVAGVDGAIYVAEGHSLTVEVPGRVLRFADPGGADFEVFAEGFPNTNGLARDDDGNLYLAHGFDEQLWRIAPDGSWSVWTTVPDGVNGVVRHPDGERLVIAPLGDPANTVYAIPFDDPDAREVLFRFNAAPSPMSGGPPDAGRPLWQKGIDDLVVAPDGRVIVSAHLREQFVMGDPATGEACILLEGVRAEPSSVRVASDFGPWDGWAFTTDFAGDVYAVDIRGNATATDGAGEAQNATGDDAEEPAATPTAGVGLVLVAVLGAVLVRRPKA